MASGDVSQLSDVASDIISKILETEKEKQLKEKQLQEKSQQMNEALRDEYQNKISDSVKRNITENSSIEQEKNNPEQTSNDSNNDIEKGLSKEEIEPLLNDEFKKIEALVNDKGIEDVNIDDFRNKLQTLAKDFDKKMTPRRSPAEAIKHHMGRAKLGTKSFAMDKINKFMNKMNTKIKEMSSQIDKKFNTEQKEQANEQSVNNEKRETENNSEYVEEKEQEKVQTVTYEQKIENTLRNDPDLFKATLAATQINSMRGHLEESRDSLNQLSELTKDDPIEQYKIDDMKNQLGSHIKGMENELNQLEQSHNPEETMQKLQEKSSEIEHRDENEKDEEQTKDNGKTKEKVMER